MDEKTMRALQVDGVLQTAIGMDLTSVAALAATIEEARRAGPPPPRAVAAPPEPTNPLPTMPYTDLDWLRWHRGENRRLEQQLVDAKIATIAAYGERDQALAEARAVRARAEEQVGNAWAEVDRLKEETQRLEAYITRQEVGALVKGEKP